MRYFTDEQLREMRENARNDYDSDQVNRCLTCITRIELLDKRNDRFGDCRTELLQAIGELERVTAQYVHRAVCTPRQDRPER